MCYLRTQADESSNTKVDIGKIRVNNDQDLIEQEFQEYSYLSEVGARGLLEFGEKKRFWTIKIGKT